MSELDVVYFEQLTYIKKTTSITNHVLIVKYLIRTMYIKLRKLYANEN